MPDTTGPTLRERCRPLRIWKSLDPERRQKAAIAFWKSESVKAEDLAAAVAGIAKTLKFRPQSIRTAPLAKRASYLAGYTAMSEPLAAGVLYAYHLETQIPMLTRFLETLGIEHENGRITGEVKPPEKAALESAVDALLKEFDQCDVVTYIETLISQDDETWGALVEILETRGIG